MIKVPHNPDILNCIAELSSDEVFTPPNVANQMLDTLPSEIWNDETVTFLDPVSKSGVFLREITKRLLVGLEDKIPDIEKRLEHILNKQVFGIGITKLTSEISRRTLYCSKKANGKYSIVHFDHEEGNLNFLDTSYYKQRLLLIFQKKSFVLFQNLKIMEKLMQNYTKSSILVMTKLIKLNT